MTVIISKKAAEKLNELRRICGLNDEMLERFIREMPGPIRLNYFGEVSVNDIARAVIEGYVIGFSDREIVVSGEMARRIKRQYDHARSDYCDGVAETLYFLGSEEILEVDYDDVT